MQQPPARLGDPVIPNPYEVMMEAARARTEFFKKEGVAAVLRDSGKPHGLLNMTGIGGEDFEVGAIPTAFVTGEGYRMLWRLAKHGPVEMEIEIANTFSEKPVEVYNTVGEIRGTEKPEEVVLLGAHLDSWDLGTGSTDNGTGSMAVLEAARALAKLELKPKRTIRFVLFSGEEEGLVGSKKYVEAHKEELENISAVLVHDTGTGRVLTLGLHDNYQDRELVDQVLAPLGELKLLEPSTRRTFGTDHASFDEVGVPGFYAIQDGAEYSKTHHSQSDTFDKAWKDDLVQGAQVLAAWAYNTAQLPRMMPRRPLPYRPAQDGKGQMVAPNPDAVAVAKVLQAVQEDRAQMNTDIQYLSDRLGPRLTGSSKLDEASRWTQERFRSYGLENAHLEPWTIASAWTRGTARGRIVAPVEQELTLVSYGWSPSTNGAVRGNVVAIRALKPEDLEQYKGKLKGAIVLVGPPYDLAPPRNPLLTPYGESSLPLSRPQIKGEKFSLEAYRALRFALNKMVQEEGAALVLVPSDKWYGLQNISVATRDYKPGSVPTASITLENHALLWRLLDAGPVQVEVEMKNEFSGKPVTIYNTVAEIRGSEKPDEVVIIGAHLDSWDLGTGATDNGSGTTAVLAAARALARAGVKPRRTIRFVLFPGEEQGLYGSKAYVAAHQEELAKISGVLVHDSGTGRVLTIGLMRNYAARETMDRVLYPLARTVGLAEPSLRMEGGSDHVSFDAQGVPGFWCIQDPADYQLTHHSAADTFDRVRLDDLVEGAQVLAVWAYNVAQLPEMLPRKPAPSAETPAAPAEKNKKH
ncbi:MAG: M20/M25/M40 family metallo-hydrolase [Acidobacteriia bacterium]|nr:M20/M25/M40 family metallo-hydrolase [Terriglobia bacterium]